MLLVIWYFYNCDSGTFSPFVSIQSCKSVNLQQRRTTEPQSAPSRYISFILQKQFLFPTEFCWRLSLEHGGITEGVSEQDFKLYFHQFLNRCSLPNKMAELLIIQVNRDFALSAALCFTETWWNEAILHQADHAVERWNLLSYKWRLVHRCQGPQ